MENGSGVKVGEMIEVFVEHPFVLSRSKGLNSNSSFFIFGELISTSFRGFVRVRLFHGVVGAGTLRKAS